MAKSTVTGVVEAADRLTVKLPSPGAAALPSAKLASPMLSVGSGAVSSLMIVPTAEPWARVAPLGVDKVRFSVSLASTTVSPRTDTLTTLEVSPAAKVTVP